MCHSINDPYRKLSRASGMQRERLSTTHDKKHIKRVSGVKPARNRARIIYVLACLDIEKPLTTSRETKYVRRQTLQRKHAKAPRPC